MIYPPALSTLVEQLSRLPGVGPKTAQRWAFYLLGRPQAEAEALAQAIVDARRRVHPCPWCGFYAQGEGEEPCAICQDPRRDRSVVCVVEDPRDVAALEASHAYHGLYHVLGGALSPLEGIGPEELRLDALARRLDQGHVREVILATDPDVEGEATAAFLAHWLRQRPLRVTRIARGLPMGGDLDYADALTLARALEGRRELPEE